MRALKNRPISERLRFAGAGIVHGLRRERSLRTQACGLLLLLVVLLIFRPAPLWWAISILAAAGVLAAELFNTAIERLADYLHPELHPEIRIVKDCAAAGVLLVALGALGVGAALAIALLLP